MLGGAGFVGSQVCKALVLRGLAVTATTRSPDTAWRLGNTGADVVRFDLEGGDFAGLAHESAPDVIVNATGYGMSPSQKDPDKAKAVNVTAATAISQEARDLDATLIHLGTGLEYGSSPAPMDETHELRPAGLYATTKAEGGLTVLASGARAAVARVFVAYGPGQDLDRLVPETMVASLQGQPLRAGQGLAVRDYCYGADIADGIARLALEDGWRGGFVMNLGSGVPVKVRDLITAASRLAGGGAIQWGARPEREDEPACVVADVRLARDMLGWSPTTTLGKGLAETLRDVKSRLQRRA